jgi:DNA end-binding protein Ku
VNRQFVDSETGEPVEHEDQIKGYETGRGDYIRFEPEEIEKAVPDADKVLFTQAFVNCDDYRRYLFWAALLPGPKYPADAATFDLLRNGLREANVVAIARAVSFRKVRSVLIRAQGKGLIATTLNFDYEIRSDDEVFSEFSTPEVDGEMLDLALHIIGTKTGRFEPGKFDDRFSRVAASLPESAFLSAIPRKCDFGLRTSSP